MKLETTKDDEGLRIDKFLRKCLVNASLSYIFKILRTKLKINKKKVKQDYRLKEKDDIEIFLNENEFKLLSEKEAKKLGKIKNFNILYEDEDILVIDKPTGMASHSGTGVMEDNLMDQVFSYLKRSNVALVNRLDRGTSGIVLVGKNMQAVRTLNKMIFEKKVKKYYLALVKGNFKNDKGKLETYLKREEEDFEHKSVISEDNGAKFASLNYKVIEKRKDFSLLEIELSTGRMHQIRVQLQAEGHPIIGDKQYGDDESNKKLKLNRQFLHAYKIIFNHPTTGKLVEIESKLPNDLLKTIQRLN